MTRGSTRPTLPPEPAVVRARRAAWSPHVSWTNVRGLGVAPFTPAPFAGSFGPVGLVVVPYTFPSIDPSGSRSVRCCGRVPAAGGIQRLREVFDEVVDVLEAGRDADQPRRHAG